MSGKRSHAGKAVAGDRAPGKGAEGKRARSHARRLALQALYQIQINPRSWTDTVQQYVADPEAERVDLDYFRALMAANERPEGYTPRHSVVRIDLCPTISRR